MLPLDLGALLLILSALLSYLRGARRWVRWYPSTSLNLLIKIRLHIQRIDKPGRIFLIILDGLGVVDKVHLIINLDLFFHIAALII